jgi:hypothetical protein
LHIMHSYSVAVWPALLALAACAHELPSHGIAIIDGHTVMYGMCDGQMSYVVVTSPAVHVTSSGSGMYGGETHAQGDDHCDKFHAVEEVIVGSTHRPLKSILLLEFDYDDAMIIGDVRYDTQNGRVFCVAFDESDRLSCVQVACPFIGRYEDDILQNVMSNPVVRHALERQ